MANVKVFADRDKQTDGQAKNYMPPIFRYGGIIKIREWGKHGSLDIPEVGSARCLGGVSIPC
jgi:hypothetical protein